MKLLIVDDDDIKRRNLVEWLKDYVPDADFVEARSYNSALRILIGEEFDYVLLDMSMPTFDVTPDDSGGRPQPYAGREILAQMQRRGLLAKVIVITQFDRFGEGAEAMTLAELDRILKRTYTDLYAGAVFYDATTPEWQSALRDALGRPGGDDR